MILYTVDNKFLPLACISIASMVDHCNGTPPPVTILLHDVDANSKRSAQNFLSSHNLEFEFIEVETGWCQPWAARRNQSAAKFGYLRMDEFIAGAAERVIVVDADTSFVDDIQKLMTIDLRGSVVGAVDDAAVIASGQLLELRSKLGLGQQDGYLNSGLLVVDTMAWSAQHIGQACVRVFKETPDILTFNDQCALNAVLSGGYEKLPLRWNCLYGSVPTEWPVSMYHFAGSFKPWSMGLLKQLPAVRELLGEEHVEFYRAAIDKLNWHKAAFGSSPLLDTWKALRLLYRMHRSGRLERYHARKKSDALLQFAEANPHLIV